MADNQDFFGREKLVQKLVARLSESGKDARFLAMVGPSGSGKSSLVKAGLIPALWRGEVRGSEKWFVVEMLPGSHPLDELEVALTRVATRDSDNLHEHLSRDERGLVRASQLILPDDGSEIALIIDQFEEVFTMVEEETARLHFLNILRTAVSDSRSRVRVIVTLRADFYDRPLHYPDFGDLMRNRMETVLPLSAEELERAIARPAERSGVTFESGLVGAIVGDVHYQPGALPLLQYALTELFERRQGRMLTQEAYQEIGGTVGALAKRAEQLYAELDFEAQQIVRQIFMRLVTLGEGTEDTRRRVRRGDLLSLVPDSEVVDEVIDTFAAYRLLSLGNDPGTRSPTVEVAHEAIIREWDRLRIWINENREEIHMQQQLSHITEEWLNTNKDVSFLASGLRLEQFEKWANESDHALTPDERAYLDSSLAERARHESLEIERQQRETDLKQRSTRFLQALVVVLLLATLGAFGLTSEAVSQSNEARAARKHAETERERAEQQSRIAISRELVGYANDALETDSELSALLAMQAINTTYAVDNSVLPEAETVLHQAVQGLNPPLRIEAARYPSGDTHAFGFTPDDRYVVYYSQAFDPDADANPLMSIADASTGEVLSTFGAFPLGEPVVEGRLIALDWEEDLGFVAKLWDISSPGDVQVINRKSIPFDGADMMSVAPDLNYYIVYGQSIGMQLVDLSTGEQRTVPGIDPDFGRDILFSPGSTLLANVNRDGSMSLFDTSTWDERHRLSIPNAGILTGQFSRDERFIATVNTIGGVSLWDLSSGDMRSFEADFRPDLVTLNADGTRLAAGTRTGKVIVWDTTTGQATSRLSVANVESIRLNSDGTRLATQQSGAVQIWNLLPGQEYLTLANESVVDNGSANLAYSPDGERLVVASMSATPIVWDAQTGQKLFTLTGHSMRVRAAAWSPDGGTIATAGDDTDVILWDASNGKPRLTLSAHEDNIFSLAFSPDSTYVASSSRDQTVRIWDVMTGELLRTLQQPGGSSGVAWSPDGKRIAAGTIFVGSDSYIVIWNADTGARELEIVVEDSSIAAAVEFSPDGTRVLGAMQEARGVGVWDAQSGEMLFTISGHDDSVSAAAFSPDGTLIATASHDLTVRLWDANTGQELLTLSGPTGIIRLKFSPDGNYLATQSIDGATRIYIVSITELMAMAESRLTRSLTNDECQRYLHLETCP